MANDDHAAYVRKELLPMLRNDLRTIIECRCAEHGRAGGGPNFMAVLACLLACEAVGRLVAHEALKGFDRTRDFIRQVGEAAGDPRYAEVAGPLFAFFRHGIGHTFRPKHHQGVTGAVAWAAKPGGTSECVDWLRSPEGNIRLLELRRAHHLVIRQGGFRVCAQVLFLDLDSLLQSVADLLAVGDRGLVARIDANFPDWERDNARVDPKYLSQSESQFLGLTI